MSKVKNYFSDHPEPDHQWEPTRDIEEYMLSREMAYWEIFKNLQFLYGGPGFEDDKFTAFQVWLDKTMTNNQGD